MLDLLNSQAAIRTELILVDLTCLAIFIGALIAYRRAPHAALTLQLIGMGVTLLFRIINWAWEILASQGVAHMTVHSMRRFGVVESVLLTIAAISFAAGYFWQQLRTPRLA